MINREQKQITLISYTTGTDSYGQKHQTVSTQTTIEAAIYPYSHKESDSPLYTDVELLGLTRSAVSDSNSVKIGDVKYDIVFVEPTRKYNLFYLRKSNNG